METFWEMQLASDGERVGDANRHPVTPWRALAVKNYMA